MSTYVQISSGSTDSDKKKKNNKKTKQNKKNKEQNEIKLVGRAGTASHLDSSLLERGEIGGEG